MGPTGTDATSPSIKIRSSGSVLAGSIVAGRIGTKTLTCSRDRLTSRRAQPLLQRPALQCTKPGSSRPRGSAGAAVADQRSSTEGVRSRVRFRSRGLYQMLSADRHCSYYHFTKMGLLELLILAAEHLGAEPCSASHVPYGPAN